MVPVLAFDFVFFFERGEYIKFYDRLSRITRSSNTEAVKNLVTDNQRKINCSNYFTLAIYMTHINRDLYKAFKEDK